MYCNRNRKEIIQSNKVAAYWLVEFDTVKTFPVLNYSTLNNYDAACQLIIKCITIFSVLQVGSSFLEHEVFLFHLRKLRKGRILFWNAYYHQSSKIWKSTGHSLLPATSLNFEFGKSEWMVNYARFANSITFKYNQWNDCSFRLLKCMMPVYLF